uniref:Uncharacterized protein n=1 Tax=Anopheles christyi TaxID=43041 RepID=A0A182KIB7_9DIPT
MLEVTLRHFRRRLTELTLEPAATVKELHRRADVRFAADAPDRTHLSKVHYRYRKLTLDRASKRRNDERKRNGTLLHNVSRLRNVVHRRAYEARTRIALILRHELGRHERRQLTRLIGAKYTATVLLILSHHLDGIGHAFRIETLLLRHWWRCWIVTAHHAWSSLMILWLLLLIKLLLLLLRL